MDDHSRIHPITTPSTRRPLGAYHSLDPPQISPLHTLLPCTHLPMARLSGLQRDVLSLYRQCLREVRKKPMVRGLLPFQIPDYRFQPIEPQILLDLYFDLFPLISIAYFCSVFLQDSQSNFKNYARYVFYSARFIPACRVLVRSAFDCPSVHSG